MRSGQPIVIAGAGFSGAVIARELAEAGLVVEVHETRDHVAGNCHTSRDPGTGVMVHRYGPHIFHTGDEEVWRYVSRFATFRDYEHRVFATSKGQVYPLPISLPVINQFFGRTMTAPEAEAFIAEQTIPIASPVTFEDQALSTMGPALYEAFFKGYTEKQWGCDAQDLPASILKRLPLRFTDDTRYFDHPYQALPQEGYTELVAAILDHPKIELHLGSLLTSVDLLRARHMFWSGPIDAYFGFDMGRLGYRTLEFEHFTTRGQHQNCPVMNYSDRDVPYTRITEHKHFAYWETHQHSLCTREVSKPCGPDDIPYYPIRLVQEKKLLAKYVERARSERGVTFVGRLGTYRYLDMDVCIREALDCARLFLDRADASEDMPAFAVNPL